MIINNVYEGDCLDVLRTFPDNCIDTIITDPPYGLQFMGKGWDHGLPGESYWRECLRVAKPGATLMAFGGSRTYHRLVCAIEDAGWEIRDCISYFHDGTQQERAFMATLNDEQLAAYLELHYPNKQMSWCYGMGFPKAKRVNGDASPLMSKGDVCRCDVNKNNNENTYPLQNVLDRIYKVAVWESKGRDVYSNGHYETNKPQDFLGDYRHGFHSYDGFLRRAVKNVLAFLQPQECVPEHNRFAGHEDDWAFLSSRSLYQVLYNDLRANNGYFHPSQIEPVLQLFQGYEDENIPLLDLRETLNKLGGALNVLKLLDGDKSVFRNVHIYSLVFCLPLSILHMINSRKYNTIIPQIVICGKCGKLRNIWEGYTSCGLKPAFEPIVVAMKPIERNYAHNAEKWGVSGVWVDGARISTTQDDVTFLQNNREPLIPVNPLKKEYIPNNKNNIYGKGKGGGYWNQSPKGRWPANVIHSGEPEVMAEFAKAGVRTSGKSGKNGHTRNRSENYKSNVNYADRSKYAGQLIGDSGSASRFFAQCPPDPTQHPEAARFHYCPKAPPSERETPGNNHPTQKPVSLMRYLARLTKTPTGGIVLDPFGGSGTTALAAIAEGRDFILIEKDPEYAELARRRIAEYTGQEIAPKEIKVSESEKVKQLPLW